MYGATHHRTRGKQEGTRWETMKNVRGRARKKHKTQNANEQETCRVIYNRDLKIRGREGQDGNGSGRGKLSRVPSCRQKQNT